MDRCIYCKNTGSHGDCLTGGESYCMCPAGKNLQDVETKRENPMNLNAMAERLYNIAASKGFHDTPGNIGERLMLIVSELGEALEAMRAGNPPCEKCPEISSLEEEIADVFIRTMDLSHEFGVDLDKAVAVKSAYNEGRARLHGKKF